MSRGALALVVELHHPLPGPGREVGEDWACAAVEIYWPLLRVLGALGESGATDVVTLAVSPSWTALAGDPVARSLAEAEIERRVASGAQEWGRWPDWRRYWDELRAFALDRWDGDVLGPLHRVRGSGAVEVIPTTASHAWLPSVAESRIVAEAQVGLAAADHASLFGSAPGIWLPHLAYQPGLEQAIARSGLRYFGVDASALVRGTVRPPLGRFGPLITPAGAAAIAVDPDLSFRVAAGSRQQAQDARYAEPSRVAAAAADQVGDLLRHWREEGERAPRGSAPPILLAAVSAHDLGGWWTAGGSLFERLLAALAGSREWEVTTPGRFLDRYPEWPLGRPGPSAGGLLSVRPAGTDVLDRCRDAADRLADVLRSGGEAPLARRAVAQMVRALLAAQSLDWNYPPAHPRTVEQGLERGRRWLNQFGELAGLLDAGRLDPVRLALAESGPAYLPDLNLDPLRDLARDL